jgi:hypothetical protein
MKAAIGVKMGEFTSADDGLRLRDWGVALQLEPDRTGQGDAGRPQHNTGEFSNVTAQLI